METSPRFLRDPRWITALFLFGLIATGVMVATSQVAGDQLNLLARGWYLRVEGELVPFGHPTSGGGVTPGTATSLLVGLPLFLWQHHRAATLLVWLSHIAAYLLLDRTLRRVLQPEERFLFAVLYWVNPWRTYFAGFLWNPNYLFLLGAIHFWSMFRQRREATFLASTLHVLVVGIALQLNVGALLLWWRRYFHIDYPGVAFGSALVGAMLFPWLQAVWSDPSLLPAGRGFIGRGLLHLHPLLRGVTYWIRYPSLAVSGSISCLDYGHLLSEAVNRRVTPFMLATGQALYLLTLPATLLANYRLWWGEHKLWRAPVPWLSYRWSPTDSDRWWLVGVIRWAFVAALIVFGLSPVTIMSWHPVALFHIAVLPLVLVGGSLLRENPSRHLVRAVALFTLASIVMVTASALGSAMFRCGGPDCDARSVIQPELRSDHPMFDDLEIRRTCPMVTDQPGTWWPDILPE